MGQRINIVRRNAEVSFANEDNDLLVTGLYDDPSNNAITALTVYLTPKTSVSGYWVENAYGMNSGAV